MCTIFKIKTTQPNLHLLNYIKVSNKINYDGGPISFSCLYKLLKFPLYIISKYSFPARKKDGLGLKEYYYLIVQFYRSIEDDLCWCKQVWGIIWIP